MGGTMALTGPAARDFGQLWDGGTVAGLSEPQLLARFHQRRDEAAFTALVTRFGPMVRGVCRALLGDPHAADDAFQATFLVLARRAGSVRDPERLGPWLHGVARRVAAKARGRAARRRTWEVSADDLDATPAPPDRAAKADDLLRLVHEELARLPARYREPVILCLLDGRTHDDAARRLGCPVGTVKGRLWRARRLLRDRLARRGVAPSVGLVVAALVRSGRAEVPESLAQRTIRAGVALANGTKLAGGSATAAWLAERVAPPMLASALKWSVVTTVAFTVAAAGAVVFGRAGQFGPAGFSGQAPNAPIAKAEEPIVAAAPATAARPGSTAELAQRRLEAARQFFKSSKAFYEQGTITIDRLLSASQRLMEAEVDAAPDEDTRSAAIRRHMDILRQILSNEQARFEVGQGSQPNVDEAALNLVEAQYRLSTVAHGPTPGAGPAPPAGSPVPAPGMSFDGGSGGGGIGGAADFAQPRVNLDSDRNRRIVQALGQPIAMPFAQETALEDVVRYVQSATRGDDLPNGIPIYVDPTGLSQAGLTMQSPIIINLEGIPLKRSLYLALRQLGLAYTLQDGLLIISTPDGLDNILDEPTIYGAEKQPDE
jgi:RNA polymerase sigma factor (sigma-70 family)